MAGTCNKEADELSRVFNDDLEWSMTSSVFHLLILFASKLYHKLNQFISFRPDPYVLAGDAFSIVWNGKLFYIFVLSV